MSMLSLVQSFCRRTNISVPVAVLGSTDPQVLQVLALLEEEGQDLATRGDWSVLRNEATHTTIASEDQGTIDSIAPNGFDHFVPDTLWDRTDQTPLYIVSPQEWQQIKAVQATTSEPQIALRGGDLICYPAPTAGETWAFEYISKNWISSSSVYYDEFQDDSDTILLPDKIVKMGLRWRWKKEKGFDYDEDFRSYEMLIAKALGNDGMKRKLNMSHGPNTRNPRVVIPDGNFPI